MPNAVWIILAGGAGRVRRGWFFGKSLEHGSSVDAQGTTMFIVPGLHWVDRIWDTKVYVLEQDDGLVIVDAATPGRAQAVWTYLARMGHSPDEVRDIWITHGDIDHMGSLAALRSRARATLVAHRLDAPLLDGRAHRELGRPSSGLFEKLFNWAVDRLYSPVEVDHPVEDGDKLGDWEVVHTPGHTPGSVCYYHSERALAIVGDALNHHQGRLGAPPGLFTSDMVQAHASILKIAALDLEVCCFGHGPPITQKAGQKIRAFAQSLASGEE